MESADEVCKKWKESRMYFAVCQISHVQNNFKGSLFPDDHIEAVTIHLKYNG